MCEHCEGFETPPVVYPKILSSKQAEARVSLVAQVLAFQALRLFNCLCPLALRNVARAKPDGRKQSRHFHASSGAS